jgi:F420-0:gamma-glutamyl ligase
VTVEVKIGVQQAQRELVVEVDESAEDIEKRVSEALGSESGVIAFTDAKGRRLLVPGAKVAYVEIGTGVAGMVGFRS